MIKPLKTMRLCTALLALTLVKAQAASITNLDTGGNLNVGTSWVGLVAPGVSDVAVWDHTVQNNQAFTLGADTSWAGIQIFDPATLITINPGNTLTLGASGIDLSLATNGLTLSCPVVLGVNQGWNVTNGQTLTAGATLSGTGILTNNGNGTTVLGVANTYSGGTIVASGTLQVNTSSSAGVGGGITNQNGSTFRFGAAVIESNVVNFTGTTTLDLGNVGGNTSLDGAWSGNGTVNIVNMDGTASRTFTAGGNGKGSGNWTSFTGTLSMGTNSGALRFNDGGANNNLGNVGATVDLGTGTTTLTVRDRANSTINIGALKGGPNTKISIGSSGTGSTTYSVGALGVPTTFAGIFAGDTTANLLALTKVGSSTLTLTGSSTSLGTTTVTGGTLIIGDGSADGALGTGPIVNNSALVYNRPDSYTLANNISGSGTLTIQDDGTNTYTGTNTSSGATVISSGSLVLGATGLMSCPVSVASGATFDLTQNPTFTLKQTLSGSGTVNGLVTAAGGAINPGGTGAAGTLTFANGLTESGTVNNQLELSTTAGPNDLINITGDLTLTGTNNITLSHLGGGTIPLGTYPLIAYTGNFNGGLTNFAVTALGVTGTLTNIITTTPPEIAVIISPGVRGATNLTWKGDGAANNWDTTASNWVNGLTPFAFQAGDSVRFDDSGAPNTNVNLAAALLPAAVVVSNSQSYTLAGIGSIGGSGGLTKTNSGTLTVLTTNTYTGQTLIGQGVLEVVNVDIGGSASGLGAANGDPSNLVFYGSTFRYSGDSGNTDHGATLNLSGVTVDVTNASTVLTENGVLTGPGGLTKVGLGTLTLANPNTYAGGTVLSNGVLALGSNGANNNGTGSGVGATNNPVTFYGGTLQLFGYDGSVGLNYSTFYNPLVVPAGQTGTLRLFPRGPANTGATAGLFCSLSGGGTLNLVVNYVRDSLSGDWSGFTGLINVTSRNASGDEMRINNNFGYANTVLFLNGTFTMDSSLTAGATINIGELGGVSTATIGPGNSSQPNPTWCVGWKNTTNTFAGTIADDGATSITKVGTGTWLLAGQNTFTGSTIISNGVLALTNNADTAQDGTISGSTNIFVNSGAFLDVSGRSDLTMPLSSGQVLSGNGTVLGILDTSAGGTVSPGGGISGGIGALTVTNKINLGGTAWMKVDRNQSPNSDKLISLSSINYGGTLLVTNLGAPLQANDTFTLFSGAPLNNSFTLNLPNYYTWDTSQLGVNGTIRVTAVLPPPSFTSASINQSGGYITLNASNGAPNGPYAILSSTNIALEVSGWTLVQTGNFDSAGNITGLTVTADLAQPQQFYVLQGQ